MKGIYKITSPNNRIYIGQSKNINQRYSYYKNLKCKSQTRLHASFIKYGFDNHIFEIIQVVEDSSELNELERKYQEQYDCIGRGGLNCLLTNTKAKIMILSPETRALMSIARRKRVCSEETKLKMSKTLSGVKKSKEHVEKVRQKLIGFKHSDETKKNMSKAQLALGRKQKAEVTKKQQKTVIRLSDGFVFESAKEAAIDYGVKYSAFTNRLCGYSKNNTGYAYLVKTTRGQQQHVALNQGLQAQMD